MIMDEMVDFFEYVGSFDARFRVMRWLILRVRGDFRTDVWISRDEVVDFFEYVASIEARWISRDEMVGFLEYVASFEQMFGFRVMRWSIT